MKKPIRTVKPPEFFKIESNPRHSVEAIQELADSISKHGLLQALVALADGRLICGHRRLAAILLLGNIKEVPVDIYDGISAVEIDAIQLVENIQREELKQPEISAGIKKLADGGMELKEVAAMLGKGPSYATKYMYPYKCIEAVLEAFQAGAIGISHCEVMAKVSPAEQHAMLSAHFGGATRDDLVRQVRRTKRPDKVQVSRLQFPMPGKASISVAAPKLRLDAAIDVLTDAIELMKKAQAEGHDAKTFQALMKKKGGR